MEKRDLVLVVDDEPQIRETLRRALERSGHRVAMATRGDEALKTVETTTIGLIISDHKMPGMTGIEFLERAREVAPDTPRILMTAYPDIDLVMRGTNVAHLAHFLTKPFTLEEATRVIGEAMDRAERKRMVEAALERSMELAARALQAE
jgi:DNA-binding NtrC family response regulator